MIRLLLIVAIAAVITIALWRWRSGKLHFKVSSWPLGQQIEMALAALLALAAILGFAAGEIDFAAWLGLVSATAAALALLSWPNKQP